ncbi:DEAD/DEAH box helicase family protein [Streptomyces lasalocidi]
MPTLDLAAQAALAWRGDGHGEHMVIVSSMDASARKDLAAARVGSTNKATALAALMSVVGPQPDQIPALTVICTYDSLDKIENTQHTRYEVPPFDLAVMDEAHRIAGRTDKKWAVINDATLIRAERRLYMTATPRTFAAPELAQSQADTRPADSVPSRIRTRPRDSMDNEAVYGKKIFEYPLAQAIADGMAADYRIVVPSISDTELRTLLNLPPVPPVPTGRGAAYHRAAPGRPQSDVPARTQAGAGLLPPGRRRPPLRPRTAPHPAPAAPHRARAVPGPHPRAVLHPRRPHTRATHQDLHRLQERRLRDPDERDS